MSQEATFRVVSIAGLLIILPIALYHRIRSQSTGEKLDRRQEGIFILATLRPLALLLWLGIFAYMINPAWMAWSAVPLPAWLRWTGAGVYALAAGLYLWTFRSLGKNLTDTVVTRKVHNLVTSGPYAYVRHPFYDCAAVWGLANALVAANWFILAAGGVVFLLLVLRTSTEEDRLVARFGESYRAYMEHTGRFLPRVGR